MANVKQSSSIRNTIYNGKHSLLPPKCPFPSISPSYADYVPSPAIGSKDIARIREVNSHHQRTSSESFLMEEQPSWLDDLLNEPETPVRKGGHRRSSSDSCAYVDGANAYVSDYLPHGEYRFKNMISAPSWGSQGFEYYKDAGKPRNLARDSSSNSVAHPSGLSDKDHFIIESAGLSCVPLEADRFQSTATEKQDSVGSCPHESNVASEGRDTSHGKPYASETDTKCAKQQFAQRSRVRKLQYIAVLERNVQVLQAEGTEVSAELEFVNQQNLILSMENKSLKQRLESLAQEQFIKYMEHEVLEREIARLRALYQQQQQPSNTHRRAKSRDLDAQFANLSLKQKDASCGCDPLSGALQN